LAQAIGNQIKQNFPQKTVLYVTSDKFSNQLVDAIKGGSAPDFINFYQLIDVLIVDDIQFFGGKEKTQEIFFHVFNHLHQNGKQLVLTCDRPPKDLKGMADRLLSRFKWGLSVDIQAPDLETRIAILEKKMYASGIDLPRDVVEFVAHNVTTNVRELEGALNSLLLNSTINKKEPTLDIAKQVMKNFVKNISMEISIESIQALVCEYFTNSGSARNLNAEGRSREIPGHFAKSDPRQAKAFSTSLAELLKSGILSEETALEFSDNPQDFARSLRGISSAAQATRR
jgi:chromosomal replication initiator protein